MKRFQYYKRSSGGGPDARYQVARAASEYAYNVKYVAFFILWFIVAIILSFTMLSLLATHGFGGMRNRFLENSLIYVPWLCSFPVLLGSAMYPQGITLRQLGLPGALKNLFWVNVWSAALVGVLPLVGIYLCTGNQSLLVLGFYFFAMSYLPAKLVKMHYILVTMMWGLYVLLMLPVFLPHSLRLIEVQLPVPLLIGFVLVAVVFWAYTWRRAIGGWELDDATVKEFCRLSTEEILEQPDYNRQGLGRWLALPLERWQYGRLSRFSAKRFWGRMRIGLLANSDPAEWITGMFLFVFVFAFLFFSGLKEGETQPNFSRPMIYIYFSIIPIYALTILAQFMARWRDTISLHRFFPRSNRTAIREAAMQFALVMTKAWILYTGMTLAGAYLIWPNHPIFEATLPLLLFFAALLWFQYGCAILLMIALEKGFVANHGAWVLMSSAFLILLWCWLGWPITVGVLGLGTIVTFGAYRRLHTVEPDRIGRS